MPDKALSVRQPWASLIVHGIKDIENRSTLKNYRGTVWIHAGKTVDKEAFAILGSMVPEVIHGNIDYPTGGIIGSVDIYGCVHESDSIWFTGPNGLLLRHPMRIAFYPCQGRLGFFDVEVPF